MVAGNESKPLYLQNNFHGQEKEGQLRGSYANWTEPAFGHVFIPVNSAVEIEYDRRGFYIIEKKTGRQKEIEYNDRNMGFDVDEYLKYIVAPSPVVLENFSEIDRKGIADGKAYIGMSKEGVRVALGYPARHRTTSLSNDTWIYWRGRFGTRAVDFDKTGKVAVIR